MRNLTSLVWIAALAVVLGLGSARADSNLYVGSSFSTGIVMNENGTLVSEAGGSIDPSFILNGVQLPFLYCVDIPDNVYVGQTYGNTTVTGDGHVDWDGTALAVLPNAGKVAWLIDNHGVDGVNTPAAMGLQAAIWHVIYGYTLDLSTGAAAVAAYDNDLTGLSSAALDSVMWISPGNGSGTVYQGLVSKAPGTQTITTNVPEPSVAVSLLAMLGLLGGISGARKLYFRRPVQF